MEEKVYPMTLEGKAKLEAELEDLKVNKRKEIIERIKIARSYGDLSENSEYDAAKDEQAFVEGRISVIEKMIRFAQIIDDRDVADDVVQMMRTFTEGCDAVIIGDIVNGNAGKVGLQTAVGGIRLLDMLGEDQVPRIC